MAWPRGFRVGTVLQPLFSSRGLRSGPRVKLIGPPSAWAPEWRRGAECPTAPRHVLTIRTRSAWAAGLSRKEARGVSGPSHTRGLFVRAAGLPGPMLLLLLSRFSRVRLCATP